MNLINDLKTVCQRSAGTLFQDALGMAALGVMLFAALHIPSVI